jgi:hypothetical protein
MNKERMGKFEGGEERFKKTYASPILEEDKEKQYINFFIEL